MKQIILSFLLTINMFCVAQSYQPFSSNVGWCVEENYSLGAWMIDYINLGDKTFNGKNYTFFAGKGSDYFLVREDTLQKKVYVILPKDTIESLLYDFSLAKGQQISLNFSGNMVSYTVDSTYTTNTIAGNRLRIDLTTTDTNLVPSLSWIEGVGSTYNPFYLHDKTSLKMPDFIGYCLICSYSDTAVQSYKGACAIPCESMYLQSCFSFISSVELSNDRVLNNLNAYINTENELTVQVDVGSISLVTVFSNDGKLIDQIEAEDERVKIDTQSWQPGMYLIKATLHNESVISTKIMK